MRGKAIFLAIVFFLSLAPAGILSGPAFGAVESADYLCELGLFLYRQNKFDEALVEFKRVLMVDPGNKPAKEHINNIFQKEISLAGLKQKTSVSKSGIIPDKPQKQEEKNPGRDEEINRILSGLGKNKPERKKITEDPGPKEPSDSPIELGGELRMGVGFTPKDVIWKDANADKIGVPREKNWRYLWGQDRYNTYDQKIYDRLSLNMQTKFDSPLNAFVEITADPWTFIGRNHVEIPANDGTGDSVEMDLKYWSADSSVINETYRSRAGRIVRLKEIKVDDSKTTTSGLVLAPNNNVFGTIQPMDVKRYYRPFRKIWLNYTQDDYKVKVFPMSDQYEALTSDDPLRISNNHVYWEESPWLDSYEPSRMFYDDVTVPVPVNFIKKGRWVRNMSYFTRDSSDDYPHRLTFLRGLSFKADTGSYSLEGTLASPQNLWDDYGRVSSVHSAIRLKVPLGNALDLGFTTTSKIGLKSGSWDAWNQVEGLDATYNLSDTGRIYGQVSESHTDIQEMEGVHTRYDGVGTKVGFVYDAAKTAKDGVYRGEFYYTHLDNNFYPALSNYRYTRTDSQSFARHIYFSDISPDDEAIMWGDGIDRGRNVVGLRAGAKYFDERLNIDARIRNVHRNGHYIETVSRFEPTFKITPKLTSKLLAYYQHLPDTIDDYDPLIYAKTMYSLTDYFSEDDAHPKNTAIRAGLDPSVGAFSAGLKYEIIEPLSVEGVFERTNDIMDFPRGLFNDLSTFRIANDGQIWDKVEPYLYSQHLFGLPPYNYYNIIKNKFTYQPMKELGFVLSYTYNENRLTTGLDDNINHVGFETTYRPMDKLSFWLKYTFSRMEDVYKQQQIGGSDFYEGHHNFFLGTEYKLDADSNFTLLYGEYAGYSNPYQQSTWTLSTLDTQHIFRIIYKRKF